MKATTQSTDPTAQDVPPPPASTTLLTEQTSDAHEDERTPEQRTEEARAAFLASLSNVGANASAPLEMRAADIASNAAAVDKQEAEVQKQTDTLAKTTNEFQKLADDARGKLKEIGDVQNWAEMLERDLLVLEETMRIVDEEGEEGDLVEGTEALDLGFGPSEAKDKGKAKKKKPGWW